MLKFQHPDRWMRKLQMAAILTCAWAISLGTFFRVQFRTGFGIVFGDRSDGLLEIAILEHWWNVVRGLAVWRTTFFFYPVKGSLGYDDAFFLYGLIYSCFRAIRLDQLIASDLTNFTVKTIGFFAVHILLISTFRMRWSIAALGASLFTLANSTYANAGHAQLFTVSFVPVLALLVLHTIGAILAERRGAVLGWGILSALFYDAWLLTEFYTAWFTFYFVAFLVLVLLVRYGMEGLRGVLRVLAGSALPLVVVTLIGAVGLVPLVLLYAPTAAESGMHSFSTVQLYSPSIFELLNVGPGNLIYGGWDRRLAHWMGSEFQLGGEHVMGMAPLLVGMAIVGSVWVSRRNTIPPSFMTILGITTLLSWLLTIHLGRLNPWYPVYEYVPGAKAVRVISRYGIVVMLPTVILAMNTMNQLVDRPNRSRRAAAAKWFVVLVIGGVLSLEEVNTSWPLGLKRPEEIDRVNAVPQPPSGCVAFYVVNTRIGQPLLPASTDQVYSHNVDAMFIAETIDLPTVNGMASFVPRGWNLVHPEQAGYRDSVRSFAEGHHIPLSKLCKLDLRNDVWSR